MEERAVPFRTPYRRDVVTINTVSALAKSAPRYGASRPATRVNFGTTPTSASDSRGCQSAKTIPRSTAHLATASSIAKSASKANAKSNIRTPALEPNRLRVNQDTSKRRSRAADSVRRSINILNSRKSTRDQVKQKKI
jgi:hypothetical protein